MTKEKTKTTKAEPKLKVKLTVDTLADPNAVTHDLWTPIGGSTEALAVAGGIVITKGANLVFIPKGRLKKNLKGNWIIL